MADDRRRERDLILAPNEYAYILDETKGNIIDYVGPHKTSLANTDQPVFFDLETKRFQDCILEQAIKPFAIAPEGWYVVLKNPEEANKFPKTGTANGVSELSVGRKINIPGPVAFAPWPGQMVRVIPGHHLRSNQYLVVRVYDEDAAVENWQKAVIKKRSEVLPGGVATEIVGGEQDITHGETPNLTMGKLLVIKGTDVSFYIPPTGIEVVRDHRNEYVRDAVTLERLEYCILLDESGNKRFIKGPAVVFPLPTEQFVIKNDNRRFKALELNEISGLYVKVIAPYKESGKSYKVGDELFITGKDQMIYFPRPEHAIIRYGKQEINYAVAIPAGEARYVLNRLTGQIALQTGPCMFLPDPRKEVIVRRVIDPKHVALWFPGNREALEYNKKLQQLNEKNKELRSEEAALDDELFKSSTGAVPASAPRSRKKAVKGFMGDQFEREQSYTEPRTITLDTKYEGAVTINPWTGYAVQVVSKTGGRKVIVGPDSYLLEYDEILGVIALSTGKPKSSDRILKTVYLKTLYNKVSDIVTVETKDLCELKLELSYRVNFEGDPTNWFNVENYVKFLTDHMRSLLRHAVKQYGVEHFYSEAIALIRDAVLGLPDESHKRSGRFFEENGMRIYDVEILDISIEDDEIGDLLIDAQQMSVTKTLELATARKNLEVTKQTEEIKQAIARAESTTKQLMGDLRIEEIDKQKSIQLSQIETKIAADERTLKGKVDEQNMMDSIALSELKRQEAAIELKIEVSRKELAQRLESLKAEVDAVKEKASAISPQLIAAMENFSDKALAEKMADTMAPLAILGGNSVSDVFGQLLKGTILEKVLSKKDEN